MYVQEALGCDMEGLQVMVSVRVTEVSPSSSTHELLQCEPPLRGHQRHTEMKSFMLQCFVRLSSAWFGKGCWLGAFQPALHRAVW